MNGRNKHDNDKKKRLKKAQIYLTILLSESTTSLLKMNLSHLEQIHPDNPNILVITPSYYKQFDKNVGEVKENESLKALKQLLTSGESTISGSAEAEEEAEESVASSTYEEAFQKIASDVGLFSKSNFSSTSSVIIDDGTDWDEKELHENVSIKSMKSELFEARKIKPLPLLTTRSMAHSNKLNVHSHDLYVALLDSSLSSTEYMCRICHGGESLDDLVTPCRCRGTVALVHLKCLERWLKDSQHSYCELCLHHYKIEREPKYSVPYSIPAYLLDPGPQCREIILDLLAFAIYTPTAVASTYMLMVVCESLVKSNIVASGTLSSHILAFSAVFGMAAIDFTYSSWLLFTCQRHLEAWREWYNSNTTLKVVLSPIKLRPRKKQKKASTVS